MIDLGKNAVFIWGSYGVTAVIFVAMALTSFKARNQARKDVERLRPARPVTKDTSS